MSGPALPLLDLALLQTLVAVDQTGTLAKAADKVGRTQSAVSLQMQRLEQTLSLELFDRRGRALALTDAGRAMLGYAQRLLELNREAVSAVRGHRVTGQVRLGMSVDFEHTWLPKAMARFAASHARIVVELRVDRNSALEQAVARRDVDIALVFGPPAPTDTALVGTVPMAWIAANEFAWEPPAALPLLLLEQPCMFRSAALQALDSAGTRWRLAVTTPSLGGLWATAQAGMGVTVRSAIELQRGLSDVGARLGLPPLPRVGVRILESDTRATPPRVTLRRVLRELVDEFVEPGTAVSRR
jgi:DNA-binding transcriptional LysR family regulator